MTIHVQNLATHTHYIKTPLEIEVPIINMLAFFGSLLFMQCPSKIHFD
jgi:hypothetical protein